MFSVSAPPPTAAAAPSGEPLPLRSVHTTNFPALLRDLGVSVLVTTYQAGKLVMLRSGQAVARVEFEDAVQEIFAVQVLPGKRFPDVINNDRERIANSYLLPGDALDDVPAELRQRVS